MTIVDEPTRCVYGERHEAEVTFVWVEANGRNRQERRSPVCEAHAPHIIACAAVTPDNHPGASRPGIVTLRMERA